MRCGSLVAGKTVAMEISPEDAVPYLDRVPYGVVGLLTRLGATVVPSAPLVSRFAAGWSGQELADHKYAAEVLARVAQAMRWSGRCGSGGTGLRETALQAEVIAAMKQGGLVLYSPPIVGFGPNAANPHYEPHPGSDAELTERRRRAAGPVGRPEPGHGLRRPDLDGFAGAGSRRLTWTTVWETVRDARDAAMQRMREALDAGRRLPGSSWTRRPARVITNAGYGEYFVHRTGHSIDQDLHGSGPHLDDFETHDDRELLPGVGFSVEPGIYLPGRFGVRSEVNVYYGAEGPLVTPDRAPARPYNNEGVGRIGLPWHGHWCARERSIRRPIVVTGKSPTSRVVPESYRAPIGNEPETWSSLTRDFSGSILFSSDRAAVGLRGTQRLIYLSTSTSQVAVQTGVAFRSQTLLTGARVLAGRRIGSNSVFTPLEDVHMKQSCVSAFARVAAIRSRSRQSRWC